MKVQRFREVVTKAQTKDLSLSSKRELNNLTLACMLFVTKIIPKIKHVKRKLIQ